MGAAWSKWIGGGLGWAMGGPLGALLGYALGSLLDGRSQEVERNYGEMPGRDPDQPVGDFGLSLLVLTAAIMKADGKILKSELDYVKEVLKKSFGLEQARRLTLMLREVVAKDFDHRPVCRQIAENMPHSGRLELLHLLFGIALADGALSQTEDTMLLDLAKRLRISDADYQSIRALFGQTTEDFYTVLECTPDSSDEDLKKAYRRLAAKHHPDKVASLGAEAQKAAQEKFQQLNHAWDQIKKARGLQ
ncbi:MAG: TerB family tellurite resistance protein [Bacteroidia bacterium]|jgi:DnaJ like chaperone protein